ncbi:MAG: GNAT family N-acetyltransferase [Nanoarchaeota archaeon]|nr:GNAT family N-acetyltransferase [Nanoarchaeota archaeon]
MGKKIESLKKEDIFALNGLFKIYLEDLSKFYNPAQMNKFEKFLLPAKKFISKKYANKEIWILKEKEEYKGFIMFDNKNNPDLLLQNIGISDKERGLGRFLIENSFSLLKKRGSKKISLEVHKNNNRAKKLYEKLGFTLEGEYLEGSQKKGILCFTKYL